MLGDKEWSLITGNDGDPGERISAFPAGDLGFGNIGGRGFVFGEGVDIVLEPGEATGNAIVHRR